MVNFDHTAGGSKATTMPKQSATTSGLATMARSIVAGAVASDATPEAATTTTTKRVDGRRAPKFADTMTITVVVKANPKTPNTKCRTRFDAYGGYDGHTLSVAAALKAGVRRDDINWDADPKRGFITVA